MRIRIAKNYFASHLVLWEGLPQQPSKHRELLSLLFSLELLLHVFQISLDPLVKRGKAGLLKQVSGAAGMLRNEDATR